MKIGLISFSKTSTNCYRLNVSGVSVGISHETIISAQYRSTSIRRRNVWGSSTGKHMNELGVKSYDELDEDEFNQQVEALILRAVADKFEARVS